MFEAAHAELDAVDPEGKTRAELETAVGEIHRLQSHASAQELELLAAIDDLDDGGTDAAGVARTRSKNSARTAKRKSRTAKQLRNMPKAKKALKEGRINGEHADAAADAAERTSPEEADDALGDSIGDQPADLFGRRARSWANGKEKNDKQEERYRRQRAAREATSWIDKDGMRCSLLKFDPDTGKAFEKAWQENTDWLWRLDGGRDGTPGAVRTPAQRRIDALVLMVLSAAKPGKSEAGKDARSAEPTKRPHPRYLVHLRADVGRARGDDPEGVAEFADGTPLPQSVLERIACESEFAGMVYDTDGSVLWKGRAVRLATEDQWEALIDRDGGCVHCGMDPAYCVAHHIDPWAPPTAGRTDIDRLALVCNQAHHLIHHEGWVLSWKNGAWQLDRPGAERGPPGREQEAA